VDNGVATNIAAPVNHSVAPGDRILARRLGSTLEFWHDAGGLGVWTKVRGVNAPEYTSGKIGVGIWRKNGAIENFGGGNIVSNESLLRLYSPELRYDLFEDYRADSAAIVTDNDPPGDGTSNLLWDGSGITLASAEPFPGVDDLSLDYLGLLYAPGGAAQGRAATIDD
jgi:hypothetical protein